MGKKPLFIKNICFAIWGAMLAVVFQWHLRPAAEAQENPFTLDVCLEIAFENNLDIAQAEKGREEASFKLKQAQGAQYPQVDIGIQSGYTTDVTRMKMADTIVDVPPPLGKLNIPGKNMIIGEHEKADMALSLVQPIYTGGRIESGIRAAAAGLDVSAYQLALAKSRVRSQVITGFYQLASAQEFKHIALAGRDQILSHLKDANNLLDQGMLIKSELLPIDIRRLDTELKIIQAQNAIARAKASLCERMGLPPDKPLDISVDWNQCPPWPIPDALLASNPIRPEQLIAQAQIDAAAAEADMAAGGLRPQVGLTTSGHYGWPGFTATAPEWEAWWQAGVNVSWNIFDMDQRKNELHAALAKKSRLEQAKAAVDRQIELDRINTRLAYEEAYQKLMIAKEKVVSAQENFTTKENNFKVGMATNTDYLDAHTELMNAKSELAVISAQVQTAWAEYLRALGIEEWQAN